MQSILAIAMNAIAGVGTRIVLAPIFVLLLILVLLPLNATAQVETTDNHHQRLIHSIVSSFQAQNQMAPEIVECCHSNELSIVYAAVDRDLTFELPIEDNDARETYPFYGLAAYYRTVRIMPLATDHAVDARAWYAVIGRFKASLYHAPGALVEMTSDSLQITWPANTAIVLNIVSDYKSNLPKINSEFDTVPYHQFWDWLAGICKFVEWSLVNIQAHLTSNWGWAIIVFAVLIKLLLLPVSIFTMRLQRRVSQCHAILDPQLREIKANYDGEEAHTRIMDIYKANNISPFYALKPMLGTFIQLPILIAIFNALGEMHQLSGQSFFWIEDLAYPDAIVHLPFALPMFGNTINLLPILMTLVTFLLTVIFQNSHALIHELKRQKRNLYLMGVLFFVLFYPFPAAMVLYWTLANLLHIIQQHVLKL